MRLISRKKQPSLPLLLKVKLECLRVVWQLNVCGQQGGIRTMCSESPHVASVCVMYVAGPCDLHAYVCTPVACEALHVALRSVVGVGRRLTDCMRVVRVQVLNGGG